MSSPNAEAACASFDAAQTSRPVVAVDGLTKRYGMATVLDNLSLEIRAGEVHAVVGENGAGKSTLAHILSGFVRPDAGQVSIAGEVVTEFTVSDAEGRGVVLIHQELALAEHLDVASNMFLGHELHRGSVLASGEMNRRASEMLRRLGCAVSPLQRISSLPVSDRQMVEIAKALLRDARIIIMDEPTAVLTPREAGNLFSQIEQLRSEGVAIVFVSHKLEEVKRIADRVTVLRDGKYQGTWNIEELSVHDIAKLMVGRELSQIYPSKAVKPSAERAMQVRSFVVRPSGTAATFDVMRGEILGVAGLVGSGRTELFESLVGLRANQGSDVSLWDKSFRPRDYRDALDAGAVYITEDRKGHGLLLSENIAVNVTLLSQLLRKSGLIDFALEEETRDRAMREFSIDAPYPNVRVGSLSGGNQQKVMLAKSLLHKPRLIIVDEPTRGIDVGTRAQIYKMLRDLANAGNAVVVVSSDMQEIIGLSDRVMVMRDGAIAALLVGTEITEQQVVQHATGVQHSKSGAI